MEIETNDLTNSLNPNYYDPSGDKRLRIYRVGNIKFLSILFKAKDLTGHEVIATDIPTKLRPVMACYGVIQGPPNTIAAAIAKTTKLFFLITLPPNGINFVIIGLLIGYVFTRYVITQYPCF